MATCGECKFFCPCDPDSRLGPGWGHCKAGPPTLNVIAAPAEGARAERVTCGWPHVEEVEPACGEFMVTPPGQ